MTGRRGVPIRFRLALMFTALFIALLAATAAWVFVQLGSALRSGLDQSLADQAAVAVGGSDDEGIDLEDGDREGTALPSGERPTQLFAADGRLLDASDGSPRTALLEPRDVQQVLHAGTSTRERVLDDEPYRVLGVAVPGGEDAAVVAVAADLEAVGDAQEALVAALVPVGLVVASLAGVAGWWLAARGLSPVDRMTAEAAEITVGDLDRRLTVPATRDEVARLGVTVNAMLQRLTVAIERERAFTADASHELRTPLAILRAELELAAGRGAPRDVQRSVASALEETDRLGVLVDDLLVLARADAERLDSRDRIDLGDLAELVVERFRTIAGARGVRLDQRGGAVIVGDRHGLERAVANLVDNGIRHTPPGGAVWITSEPHGEGAVITVSDTGTGVDPALLGRLFERFTRSEASRPRGGAGLGLAIVAAVATAHAGGVEARNRPEGGFEVVLRLA